MTVELKSTKKPKVIWIDSGYLPKVTYNYAEELTKLFGLDLVVAQSSISPARMDAMYFCPHHPDWGAGKKRSSPKNCGCRKPEPGLLEKACRAHGILPSETVMIGDTTKDFEASRRFGCFSIGVRTGHGGQDGTCSTKPDCWQDDLASAVDWLMGGEVMA